MEKNQEPDAEPLEKKSGAGAGKKLAGSQPWVKAICMFYCPCPVIGQGSRDKGLWRLWQSLDCPVCHFMFLLSLPIKHQLLSFLFPLLPRQFEPSHPFPHSFHLFEIQFVNKIMFDKSK